MEMNLFDRHVMHSCFGLCDIKKDFKTLFFHKRTQL